MKKIGLIVSLFLWQFAAHADDEAGNYLFVVADGPFYAKCVPNDHRFSEEGKTYIYRAGEKKDSLLYAYDWYPRGGLYLEWHAGILSVIRLGSWPQGQEASAEQLALEFYDGNKRLASYSTLDLAKKPDAVSRSVSHYIVIKKILGYRRVGENDYVFELETVNGDLFSFDVATGKIKSTTKATTPTTAP